MTAPDDKSAPGAVHIRPERSYVEVPAEETRNLAFPVSAGISALAALFSIFSIAILTAVFEPIPLAQVVCYCAGLFAAPVAAVSGLLAIFRLRRSAIPRGKFSAWFGLVVGIAILAIGVNAVRPLAARNAAPAVSCKGGQYFIDRPAGWVVLPDKTFDMKSDAEMLKADGTGFATIDRFNKRPPMDALVNFLAEVCKMPHTHVHSHDHGAHEHASYAFVPVSVAITPEHRRELRKGVLAEIAYIKKRITGLEKEKQTLEIAETISKYRAQILALQSLRDPRIILMRKILAKLDEDFKTDFVKFDLAESTAEAPGGLPIIEVVFAGRSAEGEPCAALAFIWFTENKRFQIIAFVDDEEALPAVREDMLQAIAGFRIADGNQE